jgi:hypothetical protein
MIDGEEKSFPYRDLITGDVKLKYLWFYIANYKKVF